MPANPPPTTALGRFRALAPAAQGILLMLLAVLIFTLMDALAKALTPLYGTVQTVWARYVGQTVIVALLLGRRLGPALRTRYPGLQALRSVFQFGASALFFSALPFIGLAEATAVVDLNPVLITLGAALFLRERIGPRRLLGILTALAGAMIVIRPGGAVFSPYALLPLGAAFCYSGYALLTRLVGRDESVWTSLLYTALFGSLIASAVLPWHWTTPGGWGLAGLVAIGLVGAAGQLCLIRAFTLAEAAAVAPFGYVGLVFATVWGILFFGEYPDRWTIVGALVIAGAGLYVWHRETREAARPAARATQQD
jgi:drug/metabolite transporter (DMT)-like permease